MSRPAESVRAAWSASGTARTTIASAPLRPWPTRSPTQRSMPTSLGSHSSSSALVVSSTNNVAVSWFASGISGVVDVELGLDRLVGQHPFDPRHLLDLEAHGLAVLEHKRDEVPERDASRLLHLDDLLAELVALALVRARTSLMSSRVSLLTDGPRQRTESRPWLNRAAWLFSARARVSSHSATSSKPSSRAVRANPGYISLYS